MPRLEILKTYKIYIGGKFPRTESGRYYTPEGKGGKPLANVCLGSRKDYRDAVVAARKALGGWAGRAAFNRSQILYRIGEILEGRREQFVAELKLQGSTAAAANKEVDTAIDRCIYYAGWCDKFTQVFSAVNPVSSSHFNFSMHEPMGVVTVLAPEKSGLLGLISLLLPAIAGGNTVVAISSYVKPLCAVSFAEVLNASDVPGGVVNIITGDRSEILPWAVGHMDVNAIVIADASPEEKIAIKEGSAENLKRPVFADANEESPYPILALQEVKTTWHPVESSIAGGPAY